MMTLDVALTLFGAEALFDYIVAPHLSHGDYARLSTVCKALRRALRPKNFSIVPRCLREQARREGIVDSIAPNRLIRKLCWRDCLLRHATLEFAVMKKNIVHRISLVDVQRAGRRGLRFVLEFVVDGMLSIRIESCGIELAWGQHTEAFVYIHNLRPNEIVVMSRPTDDCNNRTITTTLEMASHGAEIPDHLRSYLYNDYGKTRRRVK